LLPTLIAFLSCSLRCLHAVTCCLQLRRTFTSEEDEQDYVPLDHGFSCLPVTGVVVDRHISTQRYQMAQIHPSFRASSMEAAGLRDADDDDYATYEEYAESSEEGAADGSSTYLTELHQNPQQLRLHDRVPNMTAAEAEAAALVAAVPGAPGVAVSALPAVKIPPALQASSGLGSPSSSYSSSGQLLVGSYLGAASAVGAADGAGGRSAMGGRSSRSIAAG
jgi:hypothetical protein